MCPPTAKRPKGAGAKRQLPIRREFLVDILLPILIGFALALAATISIASAAGWGNIADRVTSFNWVWLPVALAAEACAYAGYTFAYREAIRAAGGLELPHLDWIALVSSGFGIFVMRGGFAHDVERLTAAGSPAREARVRVLALGALEYVILAPATAVCAVYLIVHGDVHGALTWPWAIGVPAGLAAAYLVYRLHPRLAGLRARSSILDEAFDGIALIPRIATDRLHRGLMAMFGMGAYWFSEIFMLWATLHAFGDRPSIPALVIGFATGYALTRRTLPLAGAGAADAFLPFSLNWTGIALAPALLAVFAYRVLNAWLPVLPALIGLHRLSGARHDGVTR
jgi:uncharacterized membrane protein YbhN (UPF0104 family)